MEIPCEEAGVLQWKYTPYCSFHGNDLHGEIPRCSDLPHNHLAIWKLRPCGTQSLKWSDYLQRVRNNFFIVVAD